MFDSRRQRRIITYLLAEADTRTCVERDEDEGIWGEVLLDALVEEAVGVEVIGCEGVP